MDEAEVRRFGALFARFLDEVVHAAREAPSDAESVVERLATFLGTDPLGLPVVTEPFRPFELPTVQVAIERLLARVDVRHELVGIAGPGREHHGLSELLEVGRRHGMFWLGAVDYMTVPVSVDEERTCVRHGLYLIDDGRRAIAVLVRAGNPAQGVPSDLEVLAQRTEDARGWLADLRAERIACNVLRGQVLSFEPSDFEPGVGPVRFHRRPELARADVVLPGNTLDRIERQVVGIAHHRERLSAEGRHLKRGVLLYGPPGTGKTHTVRYLTGALRDFTVVLLAGPAIRFVAEACALARTLQPSLIVLEDCDLVAGDRSFSPVGNPLLFTVLDEMDGLSSDVDVCFLLTTNRIDLVETALAQRPGRVDLAMDIPLPDQPGRRRLLEIYGGGIELSEADLQHVVERTAGVPASFVKELTRRATLLSAAREADRTDASDVHAAADELLAAQERLTRTLLGAGGESLPEPQPAALDEGWFVHPARPSRWVGGGFSRLGHGYEP